MVDDRLARRAWLLLDAHDRRSPVTLEREVRIALGHFGDESFDTVRRHYDEEAQTYMVRGLEGALTCVPARAITKTFALP